MPFDNQIEPPQSFMAMYVKPGHSRPNAQQEAILSRYELCEDMASMLTEQAHVLKFKEDLPEAEVLLRCHRGLLDDALDLTDKESAWVILRLAELLEWNPPEDVSATFCHTSND